MLAILRTAGDGQKEDRDDEPGGADQLDDGGS
jgi:hypothetical protein